MVMATHKKSEDEKNKVDDLVITPAGPKPRSSVKHVNPNEVIVRKDDGTYEVVPREANFKSKTDIDKNMDS